MVGKSIFFILWLTPQLMQRLKRTRADQIIREDHAGRLCVDWLVCTTTGTRETRASSDKDIKVQGIVERRKETKERGIMGNR